MRRCTKNVEVDNEIIQAEYLIFDNNELNSIFNTPFNFWEKVEIFFRRAKHRMRDVYYKVYYGFERMFKDYDTTDIFSVHSKFVERYYKILTDYKNNLHGHPINLTQEEWDNIIDEMIRHLYYMDEENVDKELMMYMSEDCTPSCETIDEIMKKHKNEFFKLFSEYFYNLWD